DEHITFATIQLAKTKNHKTANRVSLIINPTNDSLCPVCALKSYAQARTQPHYAKNSMMLFVKSDGTWATKQWFISKLKQLLSHEDVAGHSFRAGGTTELVM
ncbi:11100_t:CDS:1, partial [Cetraspora pellucida]